jgi:hypothetical protein
VVDAEHTGGGKPMATSLGFYIFQASDNQFHRIASEYIGLGTKVSPKGNLFAAVAMKSSTQRFNIDSAKLMIFDSTGKLFRATEVNPGVLCWSPDGKSILYSTHGHDKEMSEGGRSLGVFVLNIANGSIHKIFGEAMGAIWAQFDDCIYVQNMDGRVLRSKRDYSRFVPTSHRSLKFSPSGRYYLGSDGDSQFLLYRTSDDADITVNSVAAIKTYLGPSARLDDGSVEWLSGDSLTFLDTKGKITYVFDCSRSKVVSGFQGKLVAFDKSGSRAVIQKDGKSSLQPLNEK